MRRSLSFGFVLGSVFWSVVGSRVAHAQWQTSSWLHVDGALVEREAKESEGLTLETRRSTGRAEVGLNLLPHLSVSAGGSYQDGGASARGVNVIGATPSPFAGGYLAETRALAHLLYPPFVLSTGLAQLNQFDNLPGAYRARTTFAYKPVQATINFGSAYVRVEQDLWTSGDVELRLSDAGGGRKNLKFKLSKAAGRGVEIGVFVPNVRFKTHVYLAYHRWALDAVDAQSDGVENVKIPKTEVTRTEVGLGVAF